MERFDPGCLMVRGTLVIELQFTAEDDKPQTVIEMVRNAGWIREFKIALLATGQMSLEHRQGDVVSRTVLDFERPDRDSTIRITYCWHAPERVGLLTLANPDTGTQFQSVLDRPQPWPGDDVAELISNGQGCRFDQTINLLAVSDEVEPVGSYAGFAVGTLVDTDTGPRRIEDLRTGDNVQTSEHGMQPIRQIITHEVPALGRYAPVRLRAPFFGLTRDLTVAPDHRLLITGVDAEYLFGTDSVLVEARYLQKMAGVPRKARASTIRYVQALLDAHVCISVAGAWGESLYLGNLADRPMLHATSPLAHIPVRQLPRHTKIASPQLCGYEAIVLVSALCA